MPARVTLVGCTAGKLARRAPAAELYVSPLFRKRRAYAEAAGQPWGILSARYGLLQPGRDVGPYDHQLSQDSPAGRRAWGTATACSILRAWPDVEAVEVHAGRQYVEAIRPRLEAAGVTVEAPLAGLMIGQHLAWYGRDQGRLF